MNNVETNNIIKSIGQLELVNTIKVSKTVLFPKKGFKRGEFLLAGVDGKV